ncbi:uncharacterized protein LOC144906663 isoform X1 [Branchiostoma floridae x Branchiostoma belcheri]
MSAIGCSEAIPPANPQVFTRTHERVGRGYRLDALHRPPHNKLKQGVTTSLSISRLLDTGSETTKMAPRRICGLSKDVTLSVLPRLHFDELMVELRRREIDARGILVRVLKGVMVLEYQEQEEYLTEAETSSKTSSIADQQSAGTDDFTLDDGDASHGDRRFSLCTSSPEQGYVSMEMDTSPKPEMTQSNPESDFAGHSDETALEAQETGPMDGKRTLIGQTSSEKAFRSELNKSEDGSDCYGIVISSTTSSSGTVLSPEGFAVDTGTVGGMAEFYTAAVSNRHAPEPTQGLHQSTHQTNEQASSCFTEEAQGGQRPLSSSTTPMSLDYRVHETTRHGNVTTVEPADTLRITKSEEPRPDCRGSVDGGAMETRGYLDNGLPLVNRQSDARRNDVPYSARSEAEHGRCPSSNRGAAQTTNGNGYHSRDNGVSRREQVRTSETGDDGVAMDDHYHHGNAAHDSQRIDDFREQVKNGTDAYYTAANVAMATESERQATANDAIIERYGNQGNIGYSFPANGVLHQSGGEEVRTNATVPLDQGTDGQHCGSYDDGNYDNGVLNLTTRNPFENVRIKVEPVDEFSEEFGQVNMQSLSGQAADGCQATASLLANQGPDYTHSAMTLQTEGDTTALNQGKTPSKWWKCPHCGFVTVHGGAVGSHLRTHATAEYPHVCSYCNFKTVTNEFLTAHVYSVHIARQVYRCPFCRYVSRTNTAVENHMVNYHWELTVLDEGAAPGNAVGGGEGMSALPRPPTKRLHCPHCAFTASRHLEMKMHMFLHDKPFVHVCRFCGYRTAERPNYVRHLRIHAGFRPHKCPYCPYSASMKHHLNDHIRTHTGEKPFLCRMCDYKAAFRSNLAQHMKKVHKVVDKFRCQHCSYTTICKQRMEGHIKQHEWKERVKRKKQQTTTDGDAATSETNTNDVIAPEEDACVDVAPPVSEMTQDQENQNDTYTES